MKLKSLLIGSAADGRRFPSRPQFAKKMRIARLLHDATIPTALRNSTKIGPGDGPLMSDDAPLLHK